MSSMKYGKIAMVLVLVVYMFALFRSGANDSRTLKQAASHSVKLVDETKSQKAGSKELKRYFGLNAEEYEGVAIYVPVSSMDVSEMLIIKAKDSAQVEEAAKAVEKRLDEQKTSFKGYGTNQTELLNGAVIDERGNFLFYAVGDKAQEMDEAFKKDVR